jgi:integrase/recombinase XerC
VIFSVVRTVRKSSSEPISLRTAVEAFLAERDLAATTRIKYRATLERVLAEVGERQPLGNLASRELVDVAHRCWPQAAPATWNRQVATLRSFAAYCRRQGWRADDPASALERRREHDDETKALPLRELDALFTRRDIPLRERALWRLLYETAARANEILELDVDDVDLANRRAAITGKGGDRELVHFQAGSARLLARLIGDRHGGPVFLASRRPAPARAPAVLDTCLESGRARLSYRRAEELFKEYSGGRTLHRLRHTALTELAAANVSLPLLMAKSRHRSLRSLQRYARPGASAVAAITAELDPARRRRRR